MKRKKELGIIAGIVSGVGAILTFSWLRSESQHTQVPARSPFALPWSSHRSLLGEVLGDMNAGNTMTLAAGIAYFSALAFFPSFAASIAIASILISPEQVASVVRELNAYLPQDVAGLVSAQLEAQAGKFGGNVAFAAAAIMVALFGASAATENTIRALNVAYGVRETRNLVKLRAVSILVLICTLLFAALLISLLIVDDYMVQWGIPAYLVDFISLVRWPLLLVLVSAGFAALYRYGPNRPRAKWRWASSGAVLGTLIWLVATVGLFLYTRHFATFANAYSLFAGIVVLMVWFNLSATALLIGAHVNARLESKTSLATTR